ncbi:MAG: hypothetical protein JW774_08295 [Candidatus Aureabacteria bacterium]|nr:hypothetical protein [Candidatus Auribacterota bacterium]
MKNLLKEIDCSRIIFLLVFFLAVIFQLENIRRSFSGSMYPREIQTLSITKGLTRDFNPFYPTIQYNGPINKYVFYEFPFYQMLVAALYHSFCHDLILSGRIVSVILWLSSLIVVFFILKTISETRSKQNGTSLYLTLIYVLACLVLTLQGSAIQPDILMFFLYNLSIFLLYQSLKKKGYFLWNVSCLVISLSILAKSYSFILLILPSLYCAYKSSAGVWQFTVKCLSWILIAVLPISLWTLHGICVYREFPGYYSSVTSLFDWFKPELFLPDNYLHYYTRILWHIRFCFHMNYGFLSIVEGFLLACSLIFFVIKGCRFWLMILLSALFYLIVFNSVTAFHYYYLLPLLLPFAVSLFFLLEHSHRAVRLAACVLFLLHFFMTSVTGRTEFNKILIGENDAKCGEMIKKMIPPHQSIIVSSYPTGGLLFFTDLYGWNLNLNYAEEAIYLMVMKKKPPDRENLIKTRFDEYVKQGADYYAITDFMNLQCYPLLINRLMDQYPIIYYDPNHLIIFDLHPAKNGRNKSD